MSNHISKVAPYSLFVALYQNRYSKKDHCKNLNKFRAFLDARRLSPETATKEQLLEFARDLQGAGLASASIRQTFCSVRMFYRYLEAIDRIIKSPASILYFVKTETPQKLPLPLHPMDRIALLSSLRTDTRDRFKISLAVRLGMECGLRVGEMAALPRTAAQLHTNSLIVTGKRGKTRNIPLTPILKTWIQNWFLKTKGKYFFPQRTEPEAFHVKPDLVNVWMKRAAAWAGVKPFTVHRLRDTFGSILAETGATAPEIKELMGHSSLMAADHYVQLCGNQAQAAHRRAFSERKNLGRHFAAAAEGRRAS